MMRSGYKTFDDLAKDVDFNEGLMAQLFDLITGEYKVASSMKQHFGDKKAYKEKQEHIDKLISFLFQSKEFEKFAVQDLVKRGTETIKSILSEEELDLDEIEVKNLQKQVKKGKVSDPRSIDFIFRRLLSSKKLKISEQPEMFVHIFEMLLILASLFGKDQKSKVPIKMMKSAQLIINLFQQTSTLIGCRRYT